MLIMNSFATVLIAALTSAAVALAIEWAAKPRLEARKDRILEQSRAKREIELQLQIIVSLSGSLMVNISSLESTERGLILSLLEENRTEIKSASRDLERALAVAYAKIDTPVRNAILRSIGAIQGYTLAGELGDETLGIDLAVASGRALDMYHTHRWQVHKRRKLAARISSLGSAEAQSS